MWPRIFRFCKHKKQTTEWKWGSKKKWERVFRMFDHEWKICVTKKKKKNQAISHISSTSYLIFN